jgi:hypothetical protein
MIRLIRHFCRLGVGIRSSSHFVGGLLRACLQCDHQQTLTERKSPMNTKEFSHSSALVTLGVACAVAAILTGSAAAAMKHSAAPAHSLAAPVATELPAVVVSAKRMTAAEKKQYWQQHQDSSVTLV